MADLQQTVGAVVRRERRKRKRTMKSLAQEAALSLVYLGEIERGKKYPSALVLERLAGALGIAVADLLEMVAGELRVAAVPARIDAVGFRLPERPAAALPARPSQLRSVLAMAA
jgi:transcriptional regulator with XRE-family HTH domain